MPLQDSLAILSSLVSQSILDLSAADWERSLNRMVAAKRVLRTMEAEAEAELMERDRMCDLAEAEMAVAGDIPF